MVVIRMVGRKKFFFPTMRMRLFLRFFILSFVTTLFSIPGQGPPKNNQAFGHSALRLSTLCQLPRQFVDCRVEIDHLIASSKWVIERLSTGNACNVSGHDRQSARQRPAVHDCQQEREQNQCHCT